MNPPAELTFDAVGKTFPGTVALAEFTLTVRPGEFVTLLGPSGCGKTTALRIAAGFERPTSGRLLTGGLDITNQAPNARNMGMVFQNYSLFPHLTVSDNVGFGPRMRRLARAETRQIARDMLDLVQLGDLAGRYPHQLSGGQQQRVALARALAMKPSVLLLDEPLSALDAKVRTEVRDEIRSLTTRLGTTTLFVTHDQEEALGVSDRICVMNAGSVEQVGSPTEVYDRPTTEFVAAFVGELNVIRLGGADVRVRPEQIHFVGTDIADCRGRIEDVSFRGSYVRYIVRLDDGQSVTVSQPHAPHVSLGREETVGLRIGTDYGKVLSK